MKTELALLLTNEGPIMSLEQVSKLLGLSPRTLQNKIYAQECPVPMFKMGEKWCAHVSDVAQYIDSQRVEAAKLSGIQLAIESIQGA